MGTADGKFVSTIESQYIRREYKGSHPAPNEKTSVQEAFKECILNEYPEHGPNIRKGWTDGDGPSKKKQKTDEEGGSVFKMEGKGAFYYALQIMIGRCIKPGDIVFDTRKDTQGHICTMTVPCYDEGAESFESEPCTSEKAAQNSACNGGLQHWKYEIEAAKDLHEEKRAQAKEEQRLHWEEKKLLREAAAPAEEAE